MERQLLLSRMKTPDGTILTSKHVHDYVTHLDKNGDTYMLDGGNEYQRYSVNDEPMEDLSIYSDSPFEEIRKYITRGTFDTNGNRVYLTLEEMTDEHLLNATMYNLLEDMKYNIYNKLYLQELIYRIDNKI
jgi:hypothetical protein